VRSIFNDEKKLSIAALSQTFAGPAHRADHAMISHQPLELFAGVLGGFKRSSQHLNEGGCDGHPKATITRVWTGAVAVAGTAVSCGAS
jgi:hypothetical protein